MQIIRNSFKEIITILIANGQVGHVFGKMTQEGNLDTPGMGIIYVTTLEKVSTYIPPELVEKLTQS